MRRPPDARVCYGNQIRCILYFWKENNPNTNSIHISLYCHMTVLSKQVRLSKVTTDKAMNIASCYNVQF